MPENLRQPLQQLITALVLAFAWLVILRLVFILQSGVWPVTGTAVLTDLTGAALLAICLSLARHPVARGALIITLGCFSFSAGMHLGAHGTLPRLALISKGADVVFLTSSVINIQLLFLPLYLGYAWLLHWLHRRLVSPPDFLRRTHYAALALLLLVYGLAMPSLTTPSNNLVASFLAQIPAALITPVATRVSDRMQAWQTRDPAPQEDFFHQKTGADPSASSQPPNILLIMIEGLSAGYFPSVSAYHDLEPVVTLNELEATLDAYGFRLYRNTLSMERQTDRGTFALLCGQYPDFWQRSVKITEVAEERAFPRCMPQILADHGYYTAYWQAAPMEYMNKDRFMPRIGFAEATGSDAFGDLPEARGWGPPDPVYFANILERLTALDRHTDSPWMVTLLNVGTHHPFETGGSDVIQQSATDEQTPEGEEARAPAEIRVTDPQEGRRNAMRIMSDSLARFLAELDEARILDNTLVVLTSDESGGFVRADLESTPLNNNAGMLAIRPPAIDSLERYADRDQLVVQLDIPMTIIDVAGAGEDKGPMTGRSLLAVNDRTDRELLLADTYTGLKFLLRESGQLLSCTESLLRCTTWTFEPDRLFGSLTPVNMEPFVPLDQRLILFGQSSVIQSGPDGGADAAGE